MHCMNMHPASKFDSFNFATLHTKKTAHGTHIFLETGRHRFYYSKCVEYKFWPLQPLWDPVLPRAMMAPNLPSTISQTSTSYPNTGELLGTLETLIWGHRLLETLLDWKMPFWQWMDVEVVVIFWFSGGFLSLVKGNHLSTLFSSTRLGWQLNDSFIRQILNFFHFF